MVDREYETTLIESLKLIVQSQMVLSELQTNQHRLEVMIAELEEADDEQPDRE